MQRYFIDKNQIIENKNFINIVIDEADSHHIRDVMRMHIGDNVIACIKGKKTIFLCKILNIGKNVILEVIDKKEENNELPINVTIAHGLVKKDKQEEVIRRLVELGAYAYLPVIMDRSIIKLNKKDYHFENERLLRIVKEASEQSERNEFLKLLDVIEFKDLLLKLHEFDLILFASVSSKDNLSLKDALKIKEVKNILVIIGPEGGFSDKEIKALNECSKVNTISLGKRVLRTETAPLAAMAILAYEGEN